MEPKTSEWHLSLALIVLLELSCAGSIGLQAIAFRATIILAPDCAISDLCGMLDSSQQSGFRSDPLAKQALQRLGKSARLWPWLGFCALVGTLTGCDQLATIESIPKISPEAFLQQQPSMHVALGPLDFILCQPSSSIFVLFVALWTMYAGYKFVMQAQGQRARLWWGIGFWLTGFAAFLAGMSYQAGGYEIKCAGREICTFTSWWEIAYLFFSSIGLAAFVTGAAFSSAISRTRKGMFAFAWLPALAYVGFLTYGVSTADRWLVSFDFMSAISSALILSLLGYHAIAYLRHHARIDLLHIRGWLIFIAVFVAYLGYLFSGMSQALWTQGIWFTENDVLHIGMVFWVYWVVRYLGKGLDDREVIDAAANSARD